MENSMGTHVDGNKLIGPNFEMTFENYIEEIIVYERHYFILVSICDKIENGVSVRGDIFDNVYCVNENGDLVWRVKPPPLEMLPYPAYRVFLQHLRSSNLLKCGTLKYSRLFLNWM